MFTEAFHWTPEQIGRLTLPQVEMYIGKKKATRKRRMTPQELEAWKAGRAG